MYWWFFVVLRESEFRPVTYTIDPAPITSGTIPVSDPVDLLQAVQGTFGRWLANTGRTLEQGPDSVEEKITLTKTPGIDKHSGYDYIQNTITPTLFLYNVVIDGQYYPEVSLSCTLHQLLNWAEKDTEVQGQPSDMSEFPPPPRTREQIIKDSGLEENSAQLEAFQDLYKELGADGLMKAVETFGGLNARERTHFLEAESHDDVIPKSANPASFLNAPVTGL